MVQVAGNIAALTADDVYVQNVAPPTFITGAPTDVIGVVGTASWGPVNQAVLMGGQTDASAAFGPISTISPTDPHDLPSDLYLAFGQANNNGSLQGFGVRVTDGTDAAATGSLLTAIGSNVGCIVTAIYTGVEGDNISVKVSAGTQANTYSVTITPPAYLGQAEIFANLPLLTFWASLVAAVNMGLSAQRGPSNFVRMSAPYGTASAPALATTELAGGSDGRTGVTSTILLGTNNGLGVSTGLFALQGTNPPVGLPWLVNCTDETVAPTIAAYCAASGASTVFPFPAGTSTAAAQADAQSAGISSPNFAFCTNWIYWNDTVNGGLRFSAPTAVLMGTIATLQPQESPGNTPVQLVVGTERNNPVTGTVNYGDTEIGVLESAGIMLITNPIPAGSTFGIRHGMTTSSNPVTAPFEYARMTNYLTRSAAAVFGLFVDELQSAQPNDPLRQAVKLASDNFLSNLQGLGQIDSFLTICSFSSASGATPGFGVNTPASVAQHYLYHMWRVKYLSSVRFFILSLQGGTTVVTVNNSAPGT